MKFIPVLNSALFLKYDYQTKTGNYYYKFYNFMFVASIPTKNLLIVRKRGYLFYVRK